MELQLLLLLIDPNRSELLAIYHWQFWLLRKDHQLKMEQHYLDALQYL